MSSELVIDLDIENVDDKIVIDNEEEQAATQWDNSPIDADFSKKLKLSEEEKQALKRAENNEVQPTVINDITNDHDYELSDEQLKECLQLQMGLTDFIKDKTEMDESQDITTLSTGIDLLDAIAGGGPAVGKIMVIAGPPGTFKSSILGNIIGASQRKFKGKCLSTYIDSEEATSTERLVQLGVKYPPIKPINNVTIEQVFQAVECQCLYKNLNNIIDIPSIVGWDSIANTITEKDKDAKDQNSTIGLRARILSFALPKYLPKLTKHNVAMIAVNQLREKIEMNAMVHTQNDLRWMGQDKTMPCGQAIKYNAFHLLMLKSKGDLKAEMYGFNGIQLEAKFIKNKLFTPNIPITLIVDFRKGVSNFWTNYAFLVQTERIKSSAWCKFAHDPSVTWRTAAAEEMYNTNEKNFKTIFNEQVKESIKINIIDKYKDSTEYDDLMKKVEEMNVTSDKKKK